MNAAGHPAGLIPHQRRRWFNTVDAAGSASTSPRRGAAKVMEGFGGSGVLEVVGDDVGGTYRAVYTVKFEEAVFVLHCFQKKSKHGIATPMEDMDIIRARLKVAATLAKELQHWKAHDKARH
jgi:phage-related protein